jgi:hypothetical protein
VQVTPVLFEVNMPDRFKPFVTDDGELRSTGAITGDFDPAATPVEDVEGVVRPDVVELPDGSFAMRPETDEEPPCSQESSGTC